MARWLEISVGALLAAGTLLAFREPLLAMMERWDGSPMYSYGYVVPFISAYLLWSRKEEFANQSGVPARFLGGVAIFGSLAILALGRVNAIQVLEQLSFVAVIGGIVLFLFGRPVLAVATPSIAYLLFMVPMWDTFTEPLHWPFQLQSAKLGVSLMQAIGVPVFREATIIVLPNLVIEVARECSGVNYLIAVLALALPMAFLRLHQAWRRVVLIGSALIVAGLANSLRVALIGTLAYYDVGSPLHGPFHVLHGLFVAGIGFVVIFVGLRLLEEDGSGRSPMRGRGSPAGDKLALPAWRIRDAAGLATVFWTLAFVGVAPQAQEVSLARPLEALPMHLGRWTAESSDLSAELKPVPTVIASAWSHAHRKLERLYRSDSGDVARVEVYYFAVQSQGREIISDASAALHRAATLVEIDSSPNHRFLANAVRWPEREQAGLFWYDTGGGRSEAGQLATKLTTMRRALFLGRTNGAAVVLRTSNHPQAIERLQDLAKSLQPALAGLWTSDEIR